jgi:hypothetical protein
MSERKSETKIHKKAAWSNKANYRLAMKVDDSPPDRDIFEELWARQKSDEEFEVCCIPFFIYDVNLGDTIRIVPQGEKNLVLGVSEQSGHHTFRVWLKSASPLLRDQLMAAISSFGCDFEWFDERLVALDAPDDQAARQLVNWLEEKLIGGGLDYETGRTEG